MRKNWRYKLGGQEFGPVDSEELRRLLKLGEIGLRTPVSSKSVKDWTPIGDLPEFAESAPPEPPPVDDLAMEQRTYAPLWRRGIAFVIDAALIVVLGFVLGNLASVVIVARQIESATEDSQAALRQVSIMLLFFPFAYFTVFEGSRLQASPGKLLMKIIVTDTSGYVPGFGRAALRSAAKYVSGLVFFLGFFIAPFTPRKQALHDFVARTLVAKY